MENHFELKTNPHPGEKEFPADPVIYRPEADIPRILGPFG
jgi:hypothetical protein